MNTCTASWHGTAHAYRKRRCRCPQAIAAFRKEGRHKAARRCRSQRRTSLHRTGYDEIAVVRAVAGDMSVRLTTPELNEAIDRLDRHGRTAEQVARLLGITSRTVTRRRAVRRELARLVVLYLVRALVSAQLEPANESGAAALPGHRAPAAVRQLNPSGPERTARARQEGLAA
jgi:hypothetical protein